jgi:hypothetical protein
MATTVLRPANEARFDSAKLVRSGVLSRATGILESAVVGIERFFLGSTSAALVAHPPTSALIARGTRGGLA